MPLAPNRWFRFSLRTLFVAVSVIAIIIAVPTGFVRFQTARERAALREGIRHGWMSPRSGRHVLTADEIDALTAERDKFLTEVARQLGPPEPQQGP